MSQQPQQKKTKTDHESANSNAINLADDILENIFSFLPIKEAVRNGILSRRFRKSWIWNRCLDFDKEFASGLTREEFINIVDQILKLHAAPKVNTFRLFINPIKEFSMVREWINFATMKEVEELDLDFSAGNTNYMLLPHHLLKNGSVRVLKLSLCAFILYPSLNGLRSLTTVVLRQVDLSEKSIEIVLNNCLFIELLELTKCRRLCHLNISAQNLRRFRILKVVDCSNLLYVDIDAPTHSIILGIYEY
ncbi:PREDICTED: putative FBD-associated F-box protein At1g61330 [Nelumbo nucifera]|uniref:FBD-associated F-box protein At1g61330 n=1 Tax=Nelumbo nucifera TaxID=4432 RepID=A0A1U8AZJ0_NELNU|nr:PREDICTED: putative FBD-associated F-box protein At1g61330 [Nelumbo nucifera]